MLKVPDRTVTRSMAGCECAGSMKFAGNLRRTVKGPGWLIDPSMTAILAPGGIDGTSAHFSSLGSIMMCPPPP